MSARELIINGRTISEETAPYVIAEIGHNHEGDLGKAEELVRCAAAAGADAAKLQKRDNRHLFTAAMYDEPYGGRNSYGPTYGLHRDALEFGAREYAHLAGVAREVGIDFVSTAFDVPSVDFLLEQDVSAIKMASADLTNTPLLGYAAKSGLPMIMSTGCADLDDVRRAMDTVLPLNENVAVLQCTAVYPAEATDLHLSVIETYRREFPGVVVGFSGHDKDTDLSMLAYALGARVIEKHVTLDRSRPGSDHHFSLEPAHLTELVDGLHRSRAAMGSPHKLAMDVERPAMRKMGKKLVAARDLPVGHQLREHDVAVKSPGDGLRPHRIDEILGRTLTAPMAAEDSISLDALDRAG